MASSARSAAAGRRRARRRRAQGRRRLVLLVLLAVFAGAFLAIRGGVARHNPSVVELNVGHGRMIAVPAYPHLSALRRRIVSLAESQIGYHTDPPQSYCNKFSAYWYSGSIDCPGTNRSEEWCADFAAWAWKEAGAKVTYAYVNGDLNASSASFYEWGLAHGSWHPRGSGYVPEPGDVAIYGLDPPTLVATHVAVVIGDVPGSAGPIAVNGDGDLTGFSVVEVRTDESMADLHPSGAPLSGYVSPP